MGNIRGANILSHCTACWQLYLWTGSRVQSLTVEFAVRQTARYAPQGAEWYSVHFGLHLVILKVVFREYQGSGKPHGVDESRLEPRFNP